MGLICRLALGLLTLAWAAALAIFLIATFGLFDQPRDPLGGVYLLPLGLPWNLLIGSAPDPLRAWLAAAAPLVNIALLYGLCRWNRSRRAGSAG
ncbi:MAG: hypothetical protein R3D25_10535 [Geminicoccaceae bacterium]